MAQYSIRKLCLATEREILAELGVKKRKARIAELIQHFYHHRSVFKVIARLSKFPEKLSSLIRLHDLKCHPHKRNCAYLFGEMEKLRALADRPYFVAMTDPDFAPEVQAFCEHYDRKDFVMETPAGPLQFGTETRVMGILNCTPDSFFDGGRYDSTARAVRQGVKLAEQGADILDVGGESTRPAGVYGRGAKSISAEEEMARVLPVIKKLSRRVKIPISIDTYKASVAEAAIQAGASMVNDISGLMFDPRMPEVIARYKVPVVIMHIKGTPQNMQQNPTYENLVDELYLHLQAQIELAVKAGVPRDLIIMDPGLGFGKRVWDNYEILRRLAEFRGLGCPILVGPSRKSFVGKPLNLPSAERLEGTAAAVTVAVINGAHILRVHDVAEMRRVIKIAELLAGRVSPGNQAEIIGRLNKS